VAVEVSLCGPLHVAIDGVPHEPRLRGPKAELAFAYLLLNRERTVSRDELMGELWGETGPAPVTPDAALSTLLSRLRTALSPLMLEGRAQLHLELGSDARVDYEAALMRTREGSMALQDGDAARAADAAYKALAVLDRPFLAGVTSRWVDERRRDQHDARVGTLETLARAQLRLGDLAAAEHAARRAIEEDPYRESAHAALMEILAARGNVAQALRVYDDLRHFLRDELGVTPAGEVTALNERLLRADSFPVVEAPASEGLATLVPRLPTFMTPFTGRARELAALTAHLDAVAAGEARVVMLTGEPGIGKTRLAAEVMETARARRARVLYGGTDGALPYQAFAEALGPYVLRVVDDMRRSGMETALAELARLMPDCRLGPPAPALNDAGIQRFRLFEAVASVLVHAATPGPLVLVLDDMHRADESSLKLLVHVTRAAAVPGVLVVVVHEPSDEAFKLLAELRRHRRVDDIRLGGMTAEDSERLIRAHWPDADEKVVGAVVEAADGDPLFLEEVLQAGSWTALGGGDDAFALPTGVQSGVVRRLRDLDPFTVRVLRAAAVCGMDFDLAMLQTTFDLTTEQVLDATDEAFRASLVVQRERPDHLSFAHARIREVLYDDQSASRRARMHLLIGQELLARSARPAEIAHHFWEARHVGGAADAVEQLTRAGRLADRALAWEDAAGFYAKALEAYDITGEQGVAERTDLLLVLGDAHEHSGKPDKAKAAFKEAAELGRTAGVPEIIALAALGYGRAPGDKFGADPELLKLLEEAYELRDELSAPLSTRILGRFAVERSSLDSATPAADDLAREAVAAAEELDDDVVLAIALQSRHWTLSHPEALQQRCEVARRSLALAVQAGDRERELQGREWWLFDLLELGEINRVEEQLDAYSALASEFRHPSYDGYATAMRAMLSLLRGDHDLAAEQSQRARDLLTSVGDPDAARVHALQRFELLRQIGDAAGAAGQARDAAAADGAASRALWRCLEAWAWATHGDAAQAQASVPDVHQIAPNGTWLMSMNALGHVAVDIGDADLAAYLLDCLAPFESRVAAVDGTIAVGSVAHALGRLATAVGQTERGRHWLETAVSRNEVMGAKPAAARAGADLRLLVADLTTTQGGIP
jgi:DNA-binding SARP family transcriptional activator